ncbi:hypothetical protein [Methylomonas rhizoryzae]|uniref:hypothetical protein n=1 Tax=Methylomonas rhizoryzae TaxID=2608981 RepID=UPI001231D643|nr:hypothetical protein [Methylomonas rhizoryzae]
MNETTQTLEKDHFVLYMVLAAIALVGTILAVKMSETEKFAPIKQQLNEEIQQMNIRIINEREVSQ